MELVVSKRIEKKIGIQGISEKGRPGKGEKRGSERTARESAKIGFSHLCRGVNL